MPAAELRDHTVMEILVTCRQLWGKVKDLPVTDIGESINPHHDPSVTLREASPTAASLIGDAIIAPLPMQPPKPRNSKAHKKQLLAAAAAAAQREQVMRQTEADLADLSSLTTRPLSRPKPTTSQLPTDDLVEATHLDRSEAAEKARKKKNLRFYTSQIAQKSNRRLEAGKDAGGDADLPYRERLKDRQARLNAEAEARGKKKGWKDDPREALGDDSGDENDRAVARQLREGAAADEENEYYDMIAHQTSKKKADKAARKVMTPAQRVEEEALAEGANGKRAIGYKIEKNKGLAPKRKKDVRNPRVKKKKKYEEKMKKLSSVRAVYKPGGEGRGGYAGELTGIKGNLVRSVKLSS
jgi:U3 small nucleolar RNA-associated protein 3